MVRTRYCQSLYSYLGGNCSVIDRIEEIVRSRGRYSYVVEPFAGSATVTITLMSSGLAKNAVINDASPIVYSTYHVFKHCKECILTAADILSTIGSIALQHNLDRTVLRPLVDQLAADTCSNMDIDARGTIALALMMACDKPWCRCGRLHIDRGHALQFKRRAMLQRWLRYHDQLFPRITISNTDWSAVVEELPSSDTLVYMDPPHMRGRMYYHITYSEPKMIRLFMRISRWANENPDADVMILASPEDMRYYRVRGAETIELQYKRFSGKKNLGKYYLIVRWARR